MVREVPGYVHRVSKTSISQRKSRFFIFPVLEKLRLRPTIAVLDSSPASYFF